ncbi:glycosyltransferase [Sulfuricurvum sp.]|uniref:glycosyltransferase n=1 Tax=Sulfuricurvum sp. TaxID=2025608 RepID=UPI002D5550CA|nr:glycosyltransferase [Sulfuricurvum sp.]HZF71590.1 glycosyltransferase [Sulfuricurvum sp.]
MNDQVNIILSDVLKPAGGPSGYLYNLRLSLTANNISNIHLISFPNSINTPTKNKSKIKIKIENLKKYFYSADYRIKKIEKGNLNLFSSFFKTFENELKGADINHFHLTKDLYYFKKMYPESNTINILTSHSPQPPYLEVYDILISEGYSQEKAEKIATFQKEIDQFAFINSDFIVFPCEQAVEPYADFLKENNISKEKLKYVITSSEKMKYSKNNDEFRKEYSIPENAIILSYVGRKNHIKGFDVFNDLASRFKHDDRFYFISAGIGPINPIEMKNFIDIGWTNDPGSIINASDYVVVPNRDTYFDLGVIQTMSLGKTIITTPTGGNKWFIDKDLDFIFFNIDELDSLVETIKTRHPSNAKKNEHFFNEILDNNFFAINYSKFYTSILENYTYL